MSNNNLLTDEIIEHVLAVLNRATASDRKAVQELLTTRVGCNKQLAADPTIQVANPTDEDIGLSSSDKPQVGILGIINGICGVKNGIGPIGANFKSNGKLHNFTRTRATK